MTTTRAVSALAIVLLAAACDGPPVDSYEPPPSNLQIHPGETAGLDQLLNDDFLRADGGAGCVLMAGGAWKDLRQAGALLPGGGWFDVMVSTTAGTREVRGVDFSSAFPDGSTEEYHYSPISNKLSVGPSRTPLDDPVIADWMLTVAGRVLDLTCE